MAVRFITLGFATALGFAACLTQAFAVDPGLIERAKKEGKVVYYSARQIPTVRAMAAKFKARYGIELEYSRHSNEDIVRKITSEYNAKRPTADVFDASTAFTFLLKEGVVDSYKAEEAATFDQAAKDPEGFWYTSNLYIAALAYNTSMVKPADVPKTIDDLLDPKWKGRQIVFASQYNPGGILGLIGGIEMMRGKEAAVEFAKKLKAQDPVSLDGSPSAAIDALAAGQAAICVGCLNQHVARVVAKGATVAWLPAIQPIIAYYGYIGIVKGQTNPNAARLFIEWTLSEEGQKLIEEEFALGPRPGLGSAMEVLKPKGGNFQALSITPKIISDDMPRWQKVFEDYVR